MMSGEQWSRARTSAHGEGGGVSEAARATLRLVGLLLIGAVVSGCPEEASQGAADAGAVDVAADTGAAGDSSPADGQDEDAAGTGCKTNAECSAAFDDLGPCELALCDSAKNECVRGAKKDFSPCDDGDACTEGTTCLDGQCLAESGTAVDCDDSNPCTADSCDPAAGCGAVPIDGACDDGDPCTQGDACTDGTCGGQPGACPCVATEDCALFEDADLCNGTLVCQDGACKVDKGTVVTCDTSADTPCSKTLCAPESGVCEGKSATDGTACSDGNPCTQGDACAAGACVPGESKCECEVTGDCEPFEDGDLCNGTLVCQGNLCVIGAGTPIVCEPTGTPCSSNACNATTGTCEAKPAPDGVSCSDGDACTIGDKCAGGACSGGSAVVCEDDDPCTDDGCDTEAGCTFTDNEAGCDDGDACTVEDTCVKGACVGGAEQSCDDGDPCTDDSCDGGTGCAHTANEGECDDGDACTTADACSAGSCVGGGPLVCDDGNPCTDDSCDSTSGCETTANLAACDDGDACTDGDACGGGVCVPGSAVDCDDGDPCTDDACEAVGGCEHQPGSGPCDDGDACTTDDACDSGTCAGVETSCDDGNPCTDDTCAAGVGCEHADNTAPCDDGNACTSGDACANGACAPGTNECGTACVSDGTIGCGELVAGDLQGSANDLTALYGCSGTDYAGPETVLTFAPAESGDVTITLSEEAVDTRVIVLAGDEGCDPAACLAEGTSLVTFAAAAGKAYYVVVDGVGGAVGTYSLDVACAWQKDDPCAPRETAGCEGCECESCVCGLDPFCCDTAWDAACVGECSVSCGFLGCPVEPLGCCEESTSPGCSDGDIEACVCGEDPFCCEAVWDATCVGEVTTLGCGTCVAPTGSCCEVQGTPGCNDTPVETCVCAEDPYCCEVAWDDICVASVDGLGCGTCLPAGLSCCQESQEPGCGESGVEACVCAEDAYCCNTAWDALCVEAVGGLGCGTCPPPQGDCCEATEAAGCLGPAIQECVCAEDSYCCEAAWDALCVANVDTYGCGLCAPLPGDCCEVGAGPGCADPTVEGCVCADDGYCCDVAWDSTCVGLVTSLACGTCSVTPGACCEPSGGPGCADTTIQACVCAVDAACCDVAWDDICVAEVDGFGCGTCGASLDDCCTATAAPGCADGSIEACVCGEDPICCDTAWDEICVAEVDGLGCGVCPASPGGCCTSGSGPGCADALVEACVCATDPVCCDTAWDELCVAEVDDLGCGVCPTLGDCCVTNDGPGCLDADIEACVCADDGFCCEIAWDDICVAEVTDLGCGACSTAASGCCDVSMVAGCSDPAVQSCVCAEDTYCCDSAWDDICVGEVDSLGCGTCGGLPLGSCCDAGTTPGCSDPAVEGCVCASDSFCCDTAWDGGCVFLVGDLGCGTCP